MDCPVVGAGVQEGAMKYLMNCYQCKKDYWISLPEWYHPGYHFCPVCKYPMTWVERDDVVIYQNMMNSLEG